MAQEKRKRCPNWLCSEKNLLVDLVTESFGIVENKKTDGFTMKQKLAEWCRLSDKYNSQTVHIHRTSDNLKAQWENMKKQAKKEARCLFEKMHRIHTDGGPPPEKLMDPVFERIICLIKPSGVGLYNKFDNDSDYAAITQRCSDNETQDESEQVQVIETKPALETIPVAECSLEQDKESVPPPSFEHVNMKVWGECTPQLLQTPFSKTFKNKKYSRRRRPVQTNFDQLYLKKLKALDHQLDYANIERHNAQLLFEKDLAIKNEVLKQSRIKTQILMLELKMKRKMFARKAVSS